MNQLAQNTLRTPPGLVDTAGLSFHHFGLAVSRPEPAALFLRTIGYDIGAFLFDPLQNVHLNLCHHPVMPTVEIIHPGAGPGPLDRVISVRDGLIYHLCYTADNLTDTIKKLEQASMLLLEVSPPTPAVLFGGKLVSFYVIDGFGLVEFIHLS